MIELRNVGFKHAGSQRWVLDKVNLNLHEGELVLVSGLTGSGKSTLLGAMNGLVPHFSGGTFTGDVLLEGSSIKGTAPRDLADRIGYVGQDPLAGFVADTVEEELAYGMEQLGVDPGTMRRRVEETLDLLGIADLRARSLTALSGGQQQRVAIGAVLTMHPRLLILDEPTSALDPTAAEEVLATLARLVADLGLTVVMAEHRMERVIPFADTLVLVDAGRVRSGSPAEILKDSLVAPPLIELGRFAGWDPLPLSVREARRKVRDWTEKPKQPAEVNEPPRGPRILRAAKVVVTYGSVVAVNQVDLEIFRGEVVALMGRNGSGKSSLLWALQGTGARKSGQIDCEGSVGLVPQTAADLLYLESVDEECATADRQHGVASGTSRNLLERLAPGIPGERHPRDLSEGQRLALVLALILTGRPAVIELDEPTRGLDYVAKGALAEVLRGLAAEGHGILLASHDVEFLAHVADRAIVMADGEVVSAGPAAQVLAESPAFAPQVTKVLGMPWLTVEQVMKA